MGQEPGELQCYSSYLFEIGTVVICIMLGFFYQFGTVNNFATGAECHSHGKPASRHSVDADPIMGQEPVRRSQPRTHLPRKQPRAAPTDGQPVKQAVIPESA